MRRPKYIHLSLVSTFTWDTYPLASVRTECGKSAPREDVERESCLLTTYWSDSIDHRDDVVDRPRAMGA